MRCSTPMIRVVASGANEKWLLASSRKKGNQYIRKPSKKISSVRFSTFFKKEGVPSARYLSSEKLMALPTAKRKEGNTRSVGVKPCQPACSSGAKDRAPLP